MPRQEENLEHGDFSSNILKLHFVQFFLIICRSLIFFSDPYCLITFQLFDLEIQFINQYFTFL